MSFPVEKVRADFPVLTREVNGLPLAYLDSAASAQKPNQVIDAEAEFYRHGYAAVHRGIHTLSAEATQSMENVRTQVAAFLNARSPEELVFVRGTTEGINLVANSWGSAGFTPGITSSSPRWSITRISFPGRCSASAQAHSCA
jgi:cysteine desulfurase/selenocysteine lyase